VEETSDLKVGDSVLVNATHETGRIFKLEGEGSSRQFWVDLST
jgi:hypothetical protein